MNKKRIFIVGLLFVIGVVVFYNYIYQDHRNISEEVPEFTVNTQELHSAFASQNDLAMKKYLNKTIRVDGKITELNLMDLTLNTLVFCQFEGSLNSSFQINEYVSVKGRCIGYDDLLEVVKLDQCTVLTINN
ncbi:OB-fold protein [Mangrovimonas aestuarii]|uniref:OB-fold protein n=1 Tax=Mangrovimonas aestuarii TaxID=3018443 RepID=UPI0023794923|nr:hypothetical protein [Mangrovimonas aestuarii]